MKYGYFSFVKRKLSFGILAMAVSARQITFNAIVKLQKNNVSIQ